MGPDQIFQWCNTLALLGWAILILFPNWQRSDRFLIGIMISLLAIVYTWLVASHFPFSQTKNFGSLSGVITLFQDPWAVTAGWIHYLAFDLLTGLFIRQNARRLGVPYGYVIPCLILTFLFGPIGLLLYLITRTLVTKNYFAENY